MQLPVKMPPRLAAQVAEILSKPTTAVYDPDASDWLHRRRKLLAQATREDCQEWLLLLSNGINGVTEVDLSRRLVAIWEMCEDFPVIVYCQATRNAIREITNFLPSPGECHKVFSAHIAPLLREVTALERIAAAPESLAVADVPQSIDVQWADPEDVERAAALLDATPLGNLRLVLGRLLAAGVRRFAPHNLDRVPAEFQ